MPELQYRVVWHCNHRSRGSPNIGVVALVSRTTDYAVASFALARPAAGAPDREPVRNVVRVLIHFLICPRLQGCRRRDFLRKAPTQALR